MLKWSWLFLKCFCQNWFLRLRVLKVHPRTVFGCLPLAPLLWVVSCCCPTCKILCRKCKANASLWFHHSRYRGEGSLGSSPPRRLSWQPGCQDKERALGQPNVNFKLCLVLRWCPPSWFSHCILQGTVTCIISFEPHNKLVRQEASPWPFLGVETEAQRGECLSQ